MRFSTAIRGVLLGGALAISVVQVASADTGESTPLHLGGSTATHASGGSSSGILRTIIALIVVTGVIFAISRILRRVKGRGGHAVGTGLERIATLPLAPGRSVALVRAGSDIVLVGISEQGVTALKTYTEAEALSCGIDLPPEPAPNTDQAERPFGQLLDQVRRMTVRS